MSADSIMDHRQKDSVTTHRQNPRRGPGPNQFPGESNNDDSYTTERHNCTDRRITCENTVPISKRRGGHGRQ